jgi:hypothetical protein
MADAEGRGVTSRTRDAEQRGQWLAEAELDHRDDADRDDEDADRAGADQLHR